MRVTLCDTCEKKIDFSLSAKTGYFKVKVDRSTSGGSSYISRTKTLCDDCGDKLFKPYFNNPQ